MSEGKIIIIVIFAWFILFGLSKILSKREKRKNMKLYNNNDSNLNNIKKYYYKNGDDIVEINSLDEIKSNKEENNVREKDSKEFAIVDNPNYRVPNVDLLDMPKKVLNATQEQVDNNMATIEKVLHDFHVNAKIVSVTIGPIYSLYEIDVPNGTKLSKIVSLKREIKGALCKEHVEIQAPIPGKKSCGIEIYNDLLGKVNIWDAIENIKKDNSQSKLLISLGDNMLGNAVFTDLRKSPHILMSGSTGSGKSICIKVFITSLLMRLKPVNLKLILVDTKRVELSLYNGIPHLLCPVITDPKKALVALQKLVSEMEHRYDLFEERHVKNIDEYNKMIDAENKAHEDNKIMRMPFIVLLIDELADLMMMDRESVEDTFIHLSKAAKDAGIHLVVSTQLPNNRIISPVVKTSFPTRIAFSTVAGIESRTIIDQNGAEDLLGAGDMLYLPPGEKKAQRILGPYISDEEIKRIVNFVCEQQIVQYDRGFSNYDAGEKSMTGKEDANTEVEDEYNDPLYNDIVEFVVKSGKASASLLQRRFKLGYNRAARVIDLLEERGIIGPMDGSKPREVLVKLNNNSNDDEDDEII